MKLIYTGDFERLKDFGFEQIFKNKNFLYVWQNKHFIDVIEINVKTRDLINLGDKNGNVVLYDLIRAGLVKKDE